MGGDLIELESHQGSPVHVVIEVQTRVADITGMEQLLDYELGKERCTIEFSPSRDFLDFENCLRVYNPLKCLETSVERISLVMNFLISLDS